MQSRNRIVAAHRFREERASLENDPARWIIVAYELWRHEIGRPDSAAGRLLAMVHETHDILELSAQTIRKDTLNVFLARSNRRFLI